jgi:hypothetical protein
MRKAVSGRRPPASLLHDPLLYVLGRLSGYQASVPVVADRVLSDAMRLVGPAALSTYPKGKRGASAQARRVVRHAWREMCRETDSRPSLCQTCDEQDFREVWALTETGVKHAKRLRGAYDDVYKICQGEVTAKNLYDPVVYLLGRLSGFRAGVAVSQDEVFEDAMRLAGIDVTHLSKWPPGVRDLMRRRIQSAWMEQRNRKGSEHPSLCMRPEGARPGQWGLTEAGVERASRLCDVYDDVYDLLKRRITAKSFYDPVVYLLGKRSGLRAYVAVPQEDIMDDALRLLGIDFAKLDRLPGDASSRIRKTLHRRVHWAWRNQRNGYCPTKQAALCAKPRRRPSLRGAWALTEKGVDRARDLRVVDGLLIFNPSTNVSAEYLAKNFDEIYGRITSHLRRKMRRSEIFDKIDDHAMNWITRVIQRDGLRKYVDDGKKLPPSRICAWARRSAYSDIRNDGRQPVCRVFHGALTKREIDDYDASHWTTEHVPRMINHHEHVGANTYEEHENNVDGNMIDVVADNMDVENAVLDSDAFEHTLGRISEIIMRDVEDDPEWHQQVVHDRFVKEMTLREIAKEHGLPSKEGCEKIECALARVQKLMLRARDEGALNDLLTL